MSLSSELEFEENLKLWWKRCRFLEMASTVRSEGIKLQSVNWYRSKINHLPCYLSFYSPTYRFPIYERQLPFPPPLVSPQHSYSSINHPDLCLVLLAELSVGLLIRVSGILRRYLRVNMVRRHLKEISFELSKKFKLFAFITIFTFCEQFGWSWRIVMTYGDLWRNITGSGWWFHLNYWIYRCRNISSNFQSMFVQRLGLFHSFWNNFAGLKLKKNWRENSRNKQKIHSKMYLLQFAGNLNNDTKQQIRFIVFFQEPRSIDGQ